MLVPRSYLYQGASGGLQQERKHSIASPKHVAAPRPRSTPLEARPKTREAALVRPPQPTPLIERTISEPVSIPTASPMLVQPRYHPNVRASAPRAQTVQSRGLHGGRASQKLSEKHDSRAMPSAVAALLAVTSIPPPTQLQRRRQNPRNRRISIDELVSEWRQETTSTSLEGHRSPLEALLEPFDETEDDDSIKDLEDEKDPALLSSRSVSSESIASSAPSLDAAQSMMSSYSAPSTPSFRNRRNLSARTEKIVAPSPIEQCPDDHPLRLPSTSELETTVVPTFLPRIKQPVKQKSSFRSNLTASISAFKSAAKSFSNFTAPSIPQDDMLARSFFSSSYTNEMRPKDIDGVPNPALRRYLNPLPLASADFTVQWQQALNEPTKDPDDSQPIQMQTYSRRRVRSRPRSSSGVSVGPDRNEAAVLGQSGLPALRTREPRENSDFLRVIVLEMNMRRTGKLDVKAPLRARIWLPPRKEGEGSEVMLHKGKEIPIRWVGLHSEDI